MFDLTQIKVFTVKGEYLCTAERVTETHPMAKILGTVEDLEDFKQKIEKQKVAGFSFGTDMKAGDSVCVYKFVAMFSSLQHPYQELTSKACEKAYQAKSTGWNELFDENTQAWQQHWETLGLLSPKTDQSAIIKAFKQLQPS